MSIMQAIFGPRPTPAVAPTDGLANPQVDNNGVVPPGTEVTKDDKNPNPSPMAEFHELWKDVPVDPNAPPKKSALDFDIDPQKMMEAAGRVDFTSALSAELLQKLKAGGDDAVAASLVAMNTIAQKTYGQSAVAASAITKEMMKAARAEFAAEIPGMLKALNLDAGLRDKNPLFEDAAVAPIMEGLKTKMLEKHPTATPAQLQAMAEKYVEKFASSFTKKPASAPGTKKQTGTPEDDWEDFAKDMGL